jgi:hypothetical protein
LCHIKNRYTVFLELDLFLPSVKRVGKHLLSWVECKTFSTCIEAVNWHGCLLIKNSSFCQTQLSTCFSTSLDEVAMDLVLKTLCPFFEYKLLDKVQKPSNSKCNVTVIQIYDNVKFDKEFVDKIDSTVTVFMP